MLTHLRGTEQAQDEARGATGDGGALVFVLKNRLAISKVQIAWEMVEFELFSPGNDLPLAVSAYCSFAYMLTETGSLQLSF